MVASRRTSCLGRLTSSLGGASGSLRGMMRPLGYATLLLGGLDVSRPLLLLGVPLGERGTVFERLGRSLGGACR